MDKNRAWVNPVNQDMLARALGKQPKIECTVLMSPDGHVYQSWVALRDGFAAFPENILFVTYDELVGSPAKTLDRIYAFLEIPSFQHTFSHIVNPVQENDEKAYNLPGMHTIRPALEKISPDARSVLGDVLWERYQGGEFWRNLE